MEEESTTLAKLHRQNRSWTRRADYSFLILSKQNKRNAYLIIRRLGAYLGPVCSGVHLQPVVAHILHHMNVPATGDLDPSHARTCKLGFPKPFSHLVNHPCNHVHVAARDEDSRVKTG